MTLHVDQEIRVWSKNDAQEAIRLTFSDHTLALTIDKAALLVTLIQLEIQTARSNLASNLERGRLLLRPGDIVIVKDDNGNEADYEVRTAPWKLGHGQWVVGLKGVSGGYSLDRVVKIVSIGTP